ncbi:COQ7-domain-containing protein [Mycena pura]|uniref:5-demethoxyubiquinone hydroxylase, mitochondrial n=1 Tax=Mycena pura TaxID=153505 RepID=A0AAD6VSP5_9AGAR|nr:COQ7-domain-containing protein [Mycena pura]
MITTTLHRARRALGPFKALRRAYSALPSAVYFDSSRSSDPSVCTTPNISHAQRQQLDSALRVDQAGEVAANYIYMGQMFVLGRDRALRPLIQDMWDQEKKHLAVMDKLQLQHRIRPTILSDVAKVAGFGLGAATALMGKEAAMACTEAVETVIGEHYDDQLKQMESLPSEHPSVPLLRDVVREFRDDELEHLDIAVEHDAQRAPAHALLSSIVGAGCKVAIELCKRV